MRAQVASPAADAPEEYEDADDPLVNEGKDDGPGADEAKVGYVVDCEVIGYLYPYAPTWVCCWCCWCCEKVFVGVVIPDCIASELGPEPAPKTGPDAGLLP